MKIDFYPKLLLLCLLVGISSLSAQLSFSGYLESEADYIKASDQSLSGYNKFRLDMEHHPREGVGIFATLEAKEFYGKKAWLLSEFLPVPDSFDTVFRMPDSLTAEYLYTTLNFNRIDLTLGKQPISLGTGYIWNPADIFNRKDMLDPTYELTGVTALRVQTVLKEFNLDFIVQPFEGGNTFSYYASGSTQLQRFELSTFVTQRVFNGQAGTKTYRGLGATGVGEVLGIGVWAELLRNKTKDTNRFRSEWVAGMDYTFESSLYCMLERYHNDWGTEYSPVEGYSLDGVFEYLDGFNRALSKDYQFAMAQYPLGDLHSISVWGILNLSDDSFVVAPQLTISLFEDVDTDFSLYIFNGEHGTEFGTQQLGGRIRLRIYY